MHFLGHKYLLLDVITNLFQKFCKQRAVNANKISQKITFENANIFHVPKSSNDKLARMLLKTLSDFMNVKERVEW